MRKEKTGVTREEKKRSEERMNRALGAYREVLRLVRRLPPETRGYYGKYARENFVNYRELDDPSSLPDLLRRAHAHSCWVLSKYSVDVSAADRLKTICSTSHHA